MRRTLTLAGAALAVIAAAATPAVAQAATATYIVELDEEPLATYTGELPGLPPTSPAVTGRKLDPDNLDSRRYEGFLESRQDRVLDRIARTPRLLYRYRNVVAGFAADLSAEEAATIRRAPNVLEVTKTRRVKMAAATPLQDPAAALGSEPPNFLGLPGGLWQRLGGPSNAGAGVIVGVIDSGIHPEHPSFADEPVKGNERLYWGPAYPPPSGFRGTCQTGERFNARDCNNKLIGARYFVEGFGVENVYRKDFISPRDADGHGSHTASTAAGNFGVDPVVFGNDLGVNLISGIAPRAYVSHYKALWTENFGGERPPEAGFGTDADIVAASDQAVADGVDVINASLGIDVDHGGATPLGRAWLRATEAGVFVAESAGNEGPGPETVGDAADAPWITAVGASTVPRGFVSQARVRDRSGAPPAPLTVEGKSLTNALPEVPLVDGEDAAAGGVSPADAELCLPGSLRRSIVSGKAVLCKRGGSFLTEKSREVLRAGGKGTLVYNETPERDRDSTDGVERHWVPTAELLHAAGLAVKQFIAAAGDPTLRLSAAKVAPQPGDEVTDFSSRGPLASVPDIVKPDVVAPGAMILAAFSPVQADDFYPGGDLFHAWQGTSMSSPHVAGVGALLADLRPSWSPGRIKSALMTSAAHITDHDGRDDPFQVGAGRIDPNRAADPGLVLDETTPRFTRYLEGIDPEGTPGTRSPLAPSDLNQPSIGLGELLGNARISRRFTSVEPGTTTWRLAFEGLEGITASASPSSFSLASNATRTVDFSFARNGAPPNEWAFGAVVVNKVGGGRSVRLPVALRPVLLDFPEQIDISAPGAAGSRPLQVQAGYDGALSSLGYGLARAATETGVTVGTTTGEPNLEGDAGSRLFPVEVPPGARALAGEITNFDGGDPNTDLDFYLYYDDEDDGFQEDDLVDFAFTLDPTERLLVQQPDAGSWLFVAVGFATRDPVSTFDFSRWLVDDPSPDNPTNAPGLRVTGDPLQVEERETVQLSVDWSGVTNPGRYLGAATYHNSATPSGANEIGQSIVWLERGG